ncbi:MAG: hypothetical protein AUJ96_01515 [Armatimonadetes bacterium CG2_30_66_41]|nr:MAG: hypothetical protein AUJ96_01515 [Armatimonadetes bacterium CG2_30_66_41]
MSLVEESIDRLAHGPVSDVEVYLDESGAPATDRRFVTGGILVYSRGGEDIAQQWEEWRAQNLLPPGKKGKTLALDELLTVAEFFATHSVLPVAVWSQLEGEEIVWLHEFAQRYRERRSPAKRFEKLAAAHWLWMHPLGHTLGTAVAAFLPTVGRFRTASVHIDQMLSETPKREHYEALLARHPDRQRMVQSLPDMGVPAPVARLLASSVAPAWRINLSARGSLSQLADFCCSMYGRYLDGTCRAPWDVVRARHAYGDGKHNLPWLGWHLDPQEWLQELRGLENHLAV